MRDCVKQREVQPSVDMHGNRERVCVVRLFACNILWAVEQQFFLSTPWAEELADRLPNNGTRSSLRTTAGPCDQRDGEGAILDDDGF